jgi:hypothetical protein
MGRDIGRQKRLMHRLAMDKLGLTEFVSSLQRVIPVELCCKHVLSSDPFIAPRLYAGEGFLPIDHRGYWPSAGA